MISNSLTQRLFLLKQEVQEIQFINPNDDGFIICTCCISCFLLLLHHAKSLSFLKKWVKKVGDLVRPGVTVTPEGRLSE